MPEQPRVTIRLPALLLDELRAEAHEGHETLSSVIRSRIEGVDLIVTPGDPTATVTVRDALREQMILTAMRERGIPRYVAERQVDLA